jgi:hypothetical protein
MGDTLEFPDRDKSLLFTIAKPWKESEITWYNADSNTAWENLDPDTKFYNPITKDTVSHPGGVDFNPEPIAFAPWGDNNTWENYDITEAMKTIIKNQETFYGFTVKMRLSPFNEHIIYAGRNYYSSEYAEIDKRPKLTVEYTSSGIYTFHAKNSQLDNMKIVNTPDNFKVFIPFEKNYKVSIYNLKGRQVYSFQGNGKKWYDLPLVLKSGMHVINLQTSDNVFVKKILLSK